MIRFFDKEVYSICLETESLERSELLSFFLRGNREEMVCLYDNNGAYCGRITYYSLLSNEDISGAIQSEHVILDEHIWKNGRKFFHANAYGIEEFPILPVVDKEHHLICFAYQDDEANRELRMLEEMEEMDDLLDFHDIFPEYESVTIEGFNELAYYFAKYLQNKKIPVCVKGAFWSEFDIGDVYEGLDFKNFVIYAEGTDQKSQIVQQRILHSVSVEFECIDLIYEENYKKGRIKDAFGDETHLWSRIDEYKNIVILGTGNKEQAAYDFLFERGFDICCFVGKTEVHTEQLQKPIMSKKEVFDSVESPLFIDCRYENSAWCAEVDEYAYRGYKRNEQYVLIKDYVQVIPNCLNHILRAKKIVLVGDIFLCNNLKKYFRKNDILSVDYCDILNKESTFKQKVWVNVDRRKKEDITEGDVVLLVAEKGIVSSTNLGNQKTVMQIYKEALKQAGIKCYSDYFSNDSVLLGLEIKKSKYTIESFIPSKIMLGCINACSGNVFFRHILDGHPNIMIMDWGYLNDNLDDFCIRLAQVKSSKMYSLFCALYERDAIYYNQPEPVRWNKFCDELRSLFVLKEEFTSQELFVLFHVACARSWEIDIKDLNKMVIYWEPHCVQRGESFENYARWLSDAQINGITFKLVRNYYIRSGSFLKWWESWNGFDGKEYYSAKAISMMYTLFRWADETEYNTAISNWERYTTRFENVKCHPKDELGAICKKLDIPWSESLLETTERGKKAFFGETTGFDLGPVYNLYEQYFSEKDRMLLSMLAAQWQKKYGYPYVNCYEFSRRELQELFLKKFRFQRMIHFVNEEEMMKYQAYVQKCVINLLQKNRRQQLIEDDNEVGESGNESIRN